MDKVTNFRKISKHGYELLISNKFSLASDGAKTHWKRDLNIQIHDWPKLLTDIKKIATSTKLRYFQYRVLNRIITTNLLRSKWDPLISPLCSFCGQQLETILHIFWSCPVIQLLWTSITGWFKRMLSLEINLTPEIVILNDYQSDCKNWINCVVVMVKQFIYASKCLHIIPTCLGALTKIHQYCMIEKTIAFKRQCTSNFFKKWHLFLTI